MPGAGWGVNCLVSDKYARRSVSRVLYAIGEPTGDDHSSGTPVTERLMRPTRMTARKPAYFEKCVIPIWSCSRWGLPCHRRYRRRGALLPHPFTLTQ